MTNIEIIANEVVENELMTKEQVEEFIGKFGYLPFMTYQEWKYNGYQVKKGSKAVIKTKLWKLVKGKKENKENKEEKDSSRFILVSASLFSMEQVEKIAQA